MFNASVVRMLMAQRNRVAKLRYEGGTYRVLSAGDHVLCAVSGAVIALDDLKYWSVVRQEAYADAATAVEAELRVK